MLTKLSMFDWSGYRLCHWCLYWPLLLTEIHNYYLSRCTENTFCTAYLFQCKKSRESHSSLQLYNQCPSWSFRINYSLFPDGLVIQQTLRQPITQGHYNLNQSSQEDTTESINGTAVPIQYITKAHEDFYNTTDAVESPDIRISGRGRNISVLL